jgi:hypothetical protein
LPIFLASRTATGRRKIVAPPSNESEAKTSERDASATFGTARRRSWLFSANVVTEEVMYIGLGGLLILILVLWLLGVI